MSKWRKLLARAHDKGTDCSYLLLLLGLRRVLLLLLATAARGHPLWRCWSSPLLQPQMSFCKVLCHLPGLTVNINGDLMVHLAWIIVDIMTCLRS